MKNINDIEISLDKEIEKVVFENKNTNDLVIGCNDKKNTIYIPEKNRYCNTLVIGTKATGKTTQLLPRLAEQDFANKSVGTTIVTTKKETAYSLYALAKKNRGRTVVLLKPSINNNISNKLLWEDLYSYDFINEFIIDYKEAIKKKHIVIIDLEVLKHRSDGIKTIGMLLLQLQLDMQETDITQKVPHHLYIDDAHYYLPFLEYLLSYSDCYNLSVTMFFQSRSQFIRKGKDYTHLIDCNVRNTILLNNLTVDDIEYYEHKFNDSNNKFNFNNRKLNSIIYETMDIYNKRRVGTAEFKLIDIDELNDLTKNAKKARVKLIKEKRFVREQEIRAQLKKKKNEKNSDKREEENRYIPNQIVKEEDIKEIIFKEEKEIKRKVSSKIFNKFLNEVEVCSDDFTYEFD